MTGTRAQSGDRYGSGTLHSRHYPPIEGHVTIIPRSDLSTTSLTYTVAGELDMPVAIPVRNLPAYS